MYDKDNDVEYLFKEDSREKKRTGTGVFSRASRRGYTGTVRTQVDFLKGKAKKEYMKNGECIVVENLYSDIKNVPSLEELRAMDRNTARNIIIAMKAQHQMKEIMNHWGFSDNYIYNKVYKVYDIPVNAKGGSKPRKQKEVSPTPVTMPATTHSLTTPTISEGFEISFVKSNTDGITIQDRITSYLSILEGARMYDVTFTIKEKK